METVTTENTRVSSATTTQKLEEFFSEICKDEILSVLDTYPEEKSVVVDYNALEMFDPDLADLLLEKPDETLESAMTAIKNIDLKEKMRNLMLDLLMLGIMFI